MSSRILLVDDERAVLKALQRAFMETSHEVFSVESGQAALDFLTENPVDMVISDMRMPGMNGHQLLRQVKALYPETLRLILSGYAQEQEIFQSLLDGSSKMYLLKPWDNDELLKLVEKLLVTRDTLQDKKVLTVVNRIEGLPTLVSRYHKINELIERDADMRVIAASIEDDVAITSRLLQVANSAIFGQVGKTGSVQQSLSLLGLTAVKNLVLATSVFEKGAPMALEKRRMALWRHCAMTNQITMAIMERRLKRKVPDTMATAGLLHDVGTIVLLNQFPQEYKVVLDMFEKDPLNGLHSIEAGLMDRGGILIRHNELGGHLLNWWDMPYPIVEAALYHHNPFHESIVNKELVVAVHLADCYSWRIMEENHRVEEDPRALPYLGMTEEDMGQLLGEIKFSLEK